MCNQIHKARTAKLILVCTGTSAHLWQQRKPQGQRGPGLSTCSWGCVPWARSQEGKIPAAQPDISAPLLPLGKPELCFSGTGKMEDVHSISAGSRACVDQEPGEPNQNLLFSIQAPYATLIMKI